MKAPTPLVNAPFVSVANMSLRPGVAWVALPCRKFETKNRIARCGLASYRFRANEHTSDELEASLARRSVARSAHGRRICIRRALDGRVLSSLVPIAPSASHSGCILSHGKRGPPARFPPLPALLGATGRPERGVWPHRSPVPRLRAAGLGPATWGNTPQHCGRRRHLRQSPAACFPAFHGRHAARLRRPVAPVAPEAAPTQGGRCDHRHVRIRIRLPQPSL